MGDSPSVRLAHLADLHLGYRQFYRQTDKGLNQREADVAQAFRQAVDGIIQAAPAAILLAGDIFHTVRPPNAAIVFAFQQLSRLRVALPNAAIVMIAGNHDTPRSVETGSILRLFEAAGVDVVADQARRLDYPALDLSVLAVPHQALAAPVAPVLEPAGAARYQVLALHGEIAGTFPSDTAVEYGGALLQAEELHADQWSYVALGHYHVMHQVAERAWYAGALDWVSTNPWGERRDEAARRLPGKGWLLVDLERGTVAPQWIVPARRVIDLPVIDAAGRTPEELSRLLRAQLDAVPGGYADQIIRQIVEQLPRHAARELDHAFLRQAKAAALHYRLDLRRPAEEGGIGLGPGGRRQTLPELLEEYLRRRPLPADVDRDAFVASGLDLLAQTQPAEDAG